MTRRARRIALTAAVLPLVVLVGLRSAWASYACQDGEVRASCCCPKKSTADRPLVDEAPRLTAQGCCDVTWGEVAPGPAAREADRAIATDAPIRIESLRILDPVDPVRSARPAAAAFTRPPPPRLPTFLANRTILR